MTSTSLGLLFGGSLDPQVWAQQHGEGLVPDRWPYGLHRLADLGFEVTATRPYQPGPIGRQAARAARAFGRLEWVETWHKLRTVAPGDTLVCWDERCGVPAALNTRRPVATGVIALTDRSSSYRQAFALALRRAHCVWALSAGQLPTLRELGLPAHRVHLLPFGVDNDFFTPDGSEPTPGLVVSAGNDRHRDFPTVMRAMELARQKLPHARIELATRQPVEVPTDLGVRHESLPHAALRSLYHSSQVVVVPLAPNQHVSGVTVALEAMACGRPVVVTDTPGMSDYVGAETGILVPPGDHEAMAAAIVRLLESADEARDMGVAAAATVAQRFTTAIMAERLAELLRAQA